MTKKVILPQVHVTLNTELESGILKPNFVAHTASSARLLVLGGRAPNSEWLNRLICDNNSALRVWAIDAGTDACCRANVIPERVIGDLDSITDEGRAWACQNGILSARDIYPSEKDDTDFQIALNLGRQANSKSNFIVTGCWGGRFDHALYGVLISLWAKDVLCMADDREILVPLQAPASLTMRFKMKPKAISLLPLERATGVTLTGVHWPLTDVPIPDWHQAPISNVLADINTDVTVSLKTGALGVYAAF